MDILIKLVFYILRTILIFSFKIFKLTCLFFFILLLLIYIFQRKLLYVPIKDFGERRQICYNPSWAADPNLWGFDIFKEHYVQSFDQTLIHCWHMSHKKNDKSIKPKTIFFLHGNANNMGYRLEILHLLYSIGFDVFICDYRGFGNSEGSDINETNISKDTLCVFKFLLNEIKGNFDDVILFGSSLGGAVSIKLLHDIGPPFKIGGLILMNTFLNIDQVVIDASEKIKKNITSIPLKYVFSFLQKYLTLIIRDHWNSMEKISNFQETPVLILNGGKDDVVDPIHSKKLFELCNSFKIKKFVKFDDCNHSDLFNNQKDKVLDEIKRLFL